jgi:hypothetical protein
MYDVAFVHIAVYYRVAQHYIVIAGLQEIGYLLLRKKLMKKTYSHIEMKRMMKISHSMILTEQNTLKELK